MIDINTLKLRNFFDSLNQPSPTTPTVGIQSPDTGSDSVLGNRISQLFQPQEDQFNRLDDMSRAMPNRAGFKPDLLRRISAFAAGLGTGSGPIGMYGGNPVGYRGDIPGGINVQHALLNQPFNEAMADHESRIKPVEELAKLEGSRNNTNRMIGSQLLSDERARERQAETERKNTLTFEAKDRQLDIAQQRAEIAAKRADIYADIAKGGTIQTDRDGKTYMVYKDGTKKDVDISQFTKEELEELRLENRLKAIAAQGAETRTTEGVRQTNRLELEDEKQGNREKTEGIRQGNRKEIKSLSGVNFGKPLSEAAKNRALITKANQVVSQRPDLKGYIQISAQGVRIPPAGVFGNKAKRDEAYKLIYGDTAETTTASSSNTQGTKRADGKVHVKRKSDGVTGWVTNPNLDIYELIP